MNYRKIAGISAMLAALFAVFTVSIPALLFLGFGALFGPSVAGAGWIIFIILFIAFFLLFFIPLFIMGVIWSLIPKNFQLLLAIILLALGVLLFQPELDFIALAGFIFTVLQGRRLKGPKK